MAMLWLMMIVIGAIALAWLLARTLRARRDVPETPSGADATKAAVGAAAGGTAAALQEETGRDRSAEEARPERVADPEADAHALLIELEADVVRLAGEAHQTLQTFKAAERQIERRLASGAWSAALGERTRAEIARRKDQFLRVGLLQSSTQRL